MTLGTEDRLLVLLEKYVQKDITIDELKELFMHISNPELKQTIIEFMDHQYGRVKTDISVHEIDWEAMYNGITKADEKKNNKGYKFNFLAIAAVFFTVFALGLYYYMSETLSNKFRTSTYKSDILPVNNVATLTLSNGKVLELSNSAFSYTDAEEGVAIKRNENGEVVYEIDESVKRGGNHIISTPYGGAFSLILADGSKVWLNASSSIIFPKTFASNERRVVVKGEAYFEVAKEINRPFYVNAGKSEVKVLGTHFSMMAYPDDVRSELSLFEGSVKFTKGNYDRIIRPRKQLQFTENSDTVTEIYAD